jgi:putative transposase
LNDNDVHARLAQFGKEGPEHGAWLGAYVLMPDHMDVFVKIDDRQQDLSTWVKSLKNALSKVLRMHSVPPPHWQKGVFDHVLRSTESYTQKWNYVRENPVRAGLSKDLKEWPFLGEIFNLEFRDDRF